MRLHAAGLLCLTALLVSGCGTVGRSPADADQSAGKELFINGPDNGQPSCGSCHVLADAGTLGRVGPNLDDSFAASRRHGFSEDTIRDVVRDQIAMSSPPMPANTVTGEDAANVAAYVAAVAGVPAGGTTTGAATTQAATTTQETTTAATTTTATTTEGTTTEAGGGASAEQGKALFASLGCIGCHSIDGAKGTGPTVKGLYGSMVKLTDGTTVEADDAFMLESIFDPDKTIVAGYTAGLMSAVIKPGSISQADAKALVAYIESLK